MKMNRKVLPIVFLWIMLQVFTVLSFTQAAPVSPDQKGRVDTLPLGTIDEDIARIAYRGTESFKYDIFWSGGIKIGELYLKLKSGPGCSECFTIDSTITSKGSIIDSLYPIHDRHITLVRGKNRLPYFGEIWQKQGRSYRAHKRISYDQEKFSVTKIKDGERPQIFQLQGTVHNEFSSFFSSRVMDLRVGSPIIVPTFGDDRRCEVVVETLAETVLKDTLLGDVKTLKVAPILTFSGLYDKRGDTVIWYTDDRCRVPVRIESKIVIGSLTAKLVEYNNALCVQYQEAQEAAAQLP